MCRTRGPPELVRWIELQRERCAAPRDFDTIRFFLTEMKQRGAAPVVRSRRHSVEQFRAHDVHPRLPEKFDIDLIVARGSRAKAHLLRSFAESFERNNNERRIETKVRFARKNLPRRDVRRRNHAFQRFEEILHGEVRGGIGERLHETPVVVRALQRECELIATAQGYGRGSCRLELRKDRLDLLNGVRGFQPAFKKKNEREERRSQADKNPSVLPVHISDGGGARPKGPAATGRPASLPPICPGRCEAARASSGVCNCESPGEECPRAEWIDLPANSP